jgi:hypothetical protein
MADTLDDMELDSVMVRAQALKVVAAQPYGVVRAWLSDDLDLWLWAEEEEEGPRLRVEVRIHSGCLYRERRLPHRDGVWVLVADATETGEPLWELADIMRGDWKRVTAQNIDRLDDADSVWERLGGRVAGSS